jgi:hypothetical protein
MRTLLGIIAGFIAAFAIMSAFEFANSLMFPFPKTMDIWDLAQVRAFAASLPASAFILLVAGWITGSFVGGWVSARIAKTSPGIATIAVGVLLTLGATFNAWLIQNPWWLHFGGLPLFGLLAYGGYRVATRFGRA